MQQKPPRKTAPEPVQGALSHSHELLLALGRAAQSIQRAHTAEDFYHAVGNEIKSLGGEVTLMMVNEGRSSLSIAYTSYSPNLIRKAEKITGLLLKDHPIPFSSNTIYGQAMDGGKAMFVQSVKQAIVEIVPRSISALTDTLISTFKLGPGILAPLRVENETLGLLKVNGKFIDENDIPVMESFAGQIATGLYNLRLMQKLQDELSARRSVEESLKHSRDLLLALSRAAQSIQKARTPEDIYRVVGEQIKALGFEATILTIDSSHENLCHSYTTLSNDIIQNAEKLAGVSARGYCWSIEAGGTYSRIIASGKSELINKAEELFTEAIPKYMRPLAGPLMKILGISQGIIAPLRVDEEDLGLLVVFGSEAISSEDEPAIDSFAGQVAISLRNARLAKQVEIELVERRLAEEAVRRTENHFRALIEKAPDGITLVGVDGKIKYTSPSARKMFGYDLDDDINESPLEHIHPDDLSSVLKAMNDLIQDPACIPTLEYRYKHKNSTYYWVESTLSNQLAEPSVQAVVINFRNITERKLIEKTLFESERYYRALIENASDGILAVDTEARIIYESPSVARLLGYDPYTLIGTNALGLIHPDDLENIANAFIVGLNTPNFVHRGEYRLRHQNGEWRYFEILSHYLTNDPVIKGVIINGRDITERKQMEGALKASENRYRILYEDNPSMYFTAKADGTVVSVNKFGAEQLGYTANELIGCSLFDIFHTEDRALVRERFTACLQNMEQSIQTEARKICKDGTILWVRESARGVHDSHGQVVILITCNDITQRKQAEEAQRASEEKANSLYQLIRLMTDNLPDLVWAKDMNGRYLFANKASVEKLLIAKDTDEPIGQTDLYFALRQRAAHPENPNWHTFGELCLGSDAIIHASQRPQRFEEYGNIKGEFLFLDVYKAPFLDEQGNMIGTVGIGRDVTYEKKLETEHKQVQEALAASEAELRALFASIQDMVLVINRDGVYTRIPPTRPGKYYISPEKVIGKHLQDFFPHERVKQILEVMEKVLTTKQTLNIEYPILIDEQTPWFEASISPMGEDATFWVARDISERKRVEAKLQLLSAALEAAANTIIITDRNGLIEWANSSFNSLTGFDPAEVIGKNSGELLKSGYQDQEFYKSLWNTILSGKVWHNELVNRRKDGTLYFEEMTITPLGNSQSEISHFIAVKQDITERKQAESALIQSEQAYRMLFENMPIGLYRTSIDGNILDANPELIRMFGFPDRATLLAKRAEELYVDTTFNDRFKTEIQKSNVLSAFEAEFRRYDHTTFWAEDYVHIIYDESGNALYYEGSLINITERKHAEDDLRRANKSLEATQSELQQMLAYEQILARTDGLTGLYNRRYFFELATREFNLTARYLHPLTIILFDVDGFKQANDTFGHDMGDRILAQIAQVAVAQVRDVDILARYGGDEFIILLPQTDARLAFIVAERIRESAASIEVETENHELLQVTLSIGVAEFVNSPKYKSIEDIIRHADQALYMAKKSGRNHTYVYSEE